MKRLVLTFQKN